MRRIFDLNILNATQPILIAWLGVVVCVSGCQAQSTVESVTAQHLSDSAQDGVTKELVAGPWMAWRGPNRNGIVIDQQPVTSWSETKNVIWKTAIPGRGHASPTVVGDQVILATVWQKQHPLFSSLLLDFV